MENKQTIKISYKDYIELYNKFKSLINKIVYPDPYKCYSDYWYDNVNKMIKIKKKIDLCDVQGEWCNYFN